LKQYQFPLNSSFFYSSKIVSKGFSYNFICFILKYILVLEFQLFIFKSVSTVKWNIPPNCQLFYYKFCCRNVFF
jgi:hypothetical protein